MPHVYRWRSPVWQADVDAFGELRSARVLRLLQETATRASADAGFDAAYYARHGTLWLVRRTTLTLLAPIRYGADLEATTWIADFRRVRSRRDYELRAADRSVAHASTDWVFVDAATTRPRRIPPELQSAFALEGAPPVARPPFRDPPPPADAARSTRRVELADLDALRHVNNATYVQYVEQAAEDAHAALGWPLAAQLARGGRFRAVAHDVEYLEAAVYGDAIDVVSWPCVAADDGSERHALLMRHGTRDLLARARSRYEWVDADGDTCMMPQELYAALSAHVR